MTYEIWNFIAKNLKANQPVMLQLVIEHSGSSPGKRGAKMAHCQSGEMVGSIGGGIMEHRLMQQGLKTLETGSKKHFSQVMDHKSKANTPNTTPSGLMCAGSQTVLQVPLYPDRATEFKELCSLLESKKAVTLLCEDNLLSFSHSRQVTLKPNCYIEKLSRINEVFIFGDGHIGNALALVLRQLNYDYYQFPTPRENKTLVECTNKNGSLHDLIKESEQPYAVIVTSSGETDLKCLRALIPFDLHYCGIMGSAAKLNFLMGKLQQEPVQPTWFPNIHAPIGIKINSQTPAEIAISIAAELISLINA